MNTTIKAELTAGTERIRYRLANRTAERSAPTHGGPVTTSAAQRQLLEELAGAVDEWRTSAEGQALLASPEGIDFEELRRQLDRVAKSPQLARSRQLVLDESVGDRIGFIPQALSIGISAQIDFILGLYGSVGYAADWDDIDGTSVIYLLGAAEEGVIEGGDVGVQVGFWKNSTSDMDGYYNGQNVDVDDFAGGAVFALEQDESVVTYIVDVAAGEDDGISEDEYYCLTFSIEHLPVAQTPASHFLILTKLQCLNTSESGHDEVYFYFQPDGGTTYRYPTWNYYAMADSSDDNDGDNIWNCGRSVYFDGSVTITLKDDNDTLGSFTFSAGDFSGPGVTITKTSDIKNGLNEVEYKMSAQLFF